MKILQVNKFYYPRGGADKYFLDLAAAQETAGHKVAIFAMRHPNNQSSPWEKYFISQISFNRKNFKDKLKTPSRVLYSLEAKRKFSRLLDDFKPDIIHIHNIYHHISPSILEAAFKRKIPVVMHLHDYKLICANHALFTNGSVCQACRTNNYWQCLKNRCIKDSWPASALAAFEMYLHHSILKIYENKVNVFIAPSRFMKDMAVAFGQAADKIKIIYNPYGTSSSTGVVETLSNTKDYLLYFGRLSPEKGLEVLIKAAALSGQKLKIAGSGELESDLKELASKLKAPVEFRGFLQGQELEKIITEALAIIIPSIWYENMPLSLMEALKAGKIVIASRIGGLPEIIKDGYNGLLFKPGSAEDLKLKIDSLANIDRKKMSQAARDSVANFSSQANLKKVMAVYEKLLK